jgi:protein-disulfide isomerase
MTPGQRLGCGLAGAVLMAMTWAAPARAQSGREVEDMRKELEALKEGQAAILKELRDLRTLILGAARQPGRAPRTDTVISVDGARFLGSVRAPVTVVEFSDYQ